MREIYVKELAKYNENNVSTPCLTCGMQLQKKHRACDWCLQNLYIQTSRRCIINIMPGGPALSGRIAQLGGERASLRDAIHNPNSIIFSPRERPTRQNEQTELSRKKPKGYRTSAPKSSRYVSTAAVGAVTETH